MVIFFGLGLFLYASTACAVAGALSGATDKGNDWSNRGIQVGIGRIVGATGGTFSSSSGEPVISGVGTTISEDVAELSTDEAKALLKASNSGLRGGVSDSDMISAIKAAYPELYINPGLSGGVRRSKRASTVSNTFGSESRQNGLQSEHDMTLRNPRSITESPPSELWDGERPNFSPGVRDAVFNNHGLYSDASRVGLDIDHRIPYREYILNNLDEIIIDGWIGFP